MMKIVNKDAVIKIVGVSKGTSKHSKHVMIITDDFESSGSFESVLNEDWGSYKGKPIQEVTNIYGDNTDEFIRALDIMYSSENINTLYYSPEYIDVVGSDDIVFYAMRIGNQVDQISDASVTPKLKEHGYSIIMPTTGGKKHRCIKKDGDNRMLMF